MNSEIIQNSLNTVQAAPRFHSEKAPPTAQACSLDLFLREISRAPFRGNKWLSSLELAARRAKLIGKTHVRTPQVRRLLPKRELVRKGSEKTAKSACPRRHAAPTPKSKDELHWSESFQHTPPRGPLYVILDGGAPDLAVAAPVSRRLVALASRAHHAKTTHLRDRGDEEIFDLLKSEHLAPTRAHRCEQVWEGGRIKAP